MELSPIAKQIKVIIDGSYIAHKRGRRFRINEWEIMEILHKVTELETGVKYVPPAPVEEVVATPQVRLKKGDPGYEEWFNSLPESTTYKKK
jgi:hypothetical protein